MYCDRLGSNIQVVRRNSNSYRRVTLHGSDGSLRTFLIQSSQVRTSNGWEGTPTSARPRKHTCGCVPLHMETEMRNGMEQCAPSALQSIALPAAPQTTTGSEERIQALLRNANTRLLAHPESRRRLLQLKAPAVLVPYQGV